jgi:hypothetical protein
MYPLGLHPIGFILLDIKSIPADDCAAAKLRRFGALTHAKLIRLIEWAALFGGLFGLEFVLVGAPSADDLLAYQAAALCSLLMFLFMPAWMLAALLATMGCFIVCAAVTSADMTAGAALVVIGISPALAFLATWLDEQQTCGRRRRPNWFAKNPFFDFCGRRR